MAEYIERKAFIEAVKDIPMWGSVAAMFADGIPTADVAPVVHGRWIEDHDYLKCPECGVMVKWDFTFFDIGNWNYCPNCGAKMDGGDSNALN
jgi:rubredoxin